MVALQTIWNEKRTSATFYQDEKNVNVLISQGDFFQNL